VKLPRLKRGAPAAPRRRRSPRPDGPRTIIPDVGADDRPSWLPAAALAAGTPIALDLDAARERLRRDIPPVSDDDL
jgi:hypothetical protein